MLSITQVFIQVTLLVLLPLKDQIHISFSMSSLAVWFKMEYAMLEFSMRY